MANKRRGKLELDWVDKGDVILTKFDEKGKTYPASYRQGQIDDEELIPRELELIKTVGDPNSENMLIWGENLIALRSLERKFAGKIKLIYIDPPFNTGQDFEDYEDGIEHSIWLTMMDNRLRLAKKLLQNDGVIFVHIDQNEHARLRMLMDEIFLSNNFLTSVAVKCKSPAGVGQESYLFELFENILCYANNKSAASNKIQYFEEEMDQKTMQGYNLLLVDEGNRVPYKKYQSSRVGQIQLYKHQNYKIHKVSKKTISKPFLLKNFNKLFQTTNPQGGLVKRIIPIFKDKELYTMDYIPSKGKNAGNPTTVYFYNQRIFVWLRKTAAKKKGTIMRKIKRNNLWLDIKWHGIANEGGVTLLAGKKPEKLLNRIIEMTTEPSDYVLDFFAGSGTTGAVAHKMGRKWIMVEIRNDMVKGKALKRMKNVVKGDSTGISKEADWKGGGGFKFYKLGEPLIAKHKDYPSIKIINPKYYNTALIKIICNLEGFKFRKDDKVLHGVNKLGNKYAHITEQYVSQGYIDLLKSKLVDDEEMIIYCFNYDEKIALPFNIIIKKLPTDISKPYKMRLKI